jgi:hypothetical protein
MATGSANALQHHLKLARWSVVSRRVFARLLCLVSQEGGDGCLELGMEVGLGLFDKEKGEVG